MSKPKSSLFSNRFFVETGSVISRLDFADVRAEDEKPVAHTSITMATADLVELRDLLNKLLDTRKPPH